MRRINIATAIATALLATFAATSLQAAEVEEPGATYEVLVVINRASGDLVAKGKYERAIRRIATKPNVYPFATATNLCIAHSMLEQFDEATPQCDKAIRLAEEAASSTRNSRREKEEAKDKWAQGYSNRGVLRALGGDTEGAEADFQAAMALRQDMRAPLHNYALLKLQTTERVAVEEKD